MESLEKPPMKKDLSILVISALVLIAVYVVLQLLTAKAGITSEQYGLTWISFSAEKISELNQTMIAKGTFHYYILAHFLDFFFMSSFAAFFFTLFMYLAKRSKHNGFFVKTNRIMAVCAIGEALFDCIETTFVLISTIHPRIVPAWLPVVQGIPNIIKLLFFYGVQLWTVVLLCYGAVKSVRMMIDRIKEKAS